MGSALIASFRPIVRNSLMAAADRMDVRTYLPAIPFVQLCGKSITNLKMDLNL